MLCDDVYRYMQAEQVVSVIEHQTRESLSLSATLYMAGRYGLPVTSHVLDETRYSVTFHTLGLFNQSLDLQGR